MTTTTGRSSEIRDGAGMGCCLTLSRFLSSIPPRGRDRDRTLTGKQSTTFQAPSPSLQQEFNITWNESAYGKNGPIHVSYAPFQWPGIKMQYKAMAETGAVPQLDGAGQFPPGREEET